MFVDAWDPSYGSSFEGGGDGDGPASASSAQVDTDVEVPAAQWAPIDVPAGVRCPDVVLLVDGVRRIDAGLWTAEDDGQSFAGLAASYAAGVVRCDLRRGVAELAGARVGRGLFTASPSAGDVQAGSVRYEVHRVGGTGEASKLPAAVQAPLTALEIDVSADARNHGSDGADLLVVDGPLRNRRQLPRTIGFVKTQQKQYLPPSLTPVVTSLRAGQRTTVFALGTVVVVPAAARRDGRAVGRHRADRVLARPGPRAGDRTRRPVQRDAAEVRVVGLQGSARAAKSRADRGPGAAAARPAGRRPGAAPRPDAGHRPRPVTPRRRRPGRSTPWARACPWSRLRLRSTSGRRGKPCVASGDHPRWGAVSDWVRAQCRHFLAWGETADTLSTIVIRAGVAEYHSRAPLSISVQIHER
jgi:hypothetical protein